MRERAVPVSAAGHEVASPAALARLLDEAYAGPAWHGPALRTALKAITPAEALWRPGAGRNCVWELLLHAAYGKHRVARRLVPTNGTRFPRPLARAWWPRLPERPDAAAWREDLALLDASHRRLLDALAAVPPRRLAERRRGSPHRLADEVAGIALHDVYHAGQIRLVRRLHADRGRVAGGR